MKIRTTDLGVKEKLLEDATLQAEGASDALEAMRKDMNDMVEQEIADKEAEFAKIIDDFDQCKEDLANAGEKVRDAKRMEAEA